MPLLDLARDNLPAFSDLWVHNVPNIDFYHFDSCLKIWFQMNLNTFVYTKYRFIGTTSESTDIIPFLQNLTQQMKRVKGEYAYKAEVLAFLKSTILLSICRKLHLWQKTTLKFYYFKQRMIELWYYVDVIRFDNAFWKLIQYDGFVISTSNFEPTSHEINMCWNLWSLIVKIDV